MHQPLSLDDADDPLNKSSDSFKLEMEAEDKIEDMKQ
jgi:hypothetical protein